VRAILLPFSSSRPDNCFKTEKISDVLSQFVLNSRLDKWRCRDAHANAKLLKRESMNFNAAWQITFN